MTIPIANGHPPRRRVLYIGDPAADTSALEEVAEVVKISIGTSDEVRKSIKEAVDEHGPMDAVGYTFGMGRGFPSRLDEDLFRPIASSCKCYVGGQVGYDLFDVPFATKNGAYFANCPREIGIRTADGTLMLILTALRGLTPQDHSTHAGKWRDPSVQALNWRTKTLGIIGLGNIGTQVANMCSFLGMKVIYYNRSKSSTQFEYVTKEELYERSDVVLVLTPLTEETRHLINKESLGMMKDGVILVNVSRGPVVDEEALADALQSGKVLRVALDVYEHEPQVSPKLMANTNATLSPHWTAATDDTAPAVTQEVIENLISFVQTGKPLTPVNEPLKGSGV